jgi:hypothetical protein
MLKKLAIAAEEGLIPIKELKIKKLEGKWKGHYRMRTDGIRIIYQNKEKLKKLLTHLTQPTHLTHLIPTPLIGEKTKRRNEETTKRREKRALRREAF